MEIIHKVVKDFTFNGRRCIIILIDNKIELPKPKYIKLDDYIRPYHNGYVEIKNYEKDIEINTEEKTYCGTLDFKNLNISDGKTYIGFDTMHYYNMQHPKTQTVENVSHRCKLITEELDRIQFWTKLKYWFRYNYNVLRYIVIGKVNG